MSKAAVGGIAVDCAGAPQYGTTEQREGQPRQRMVADPALVGNRSAAVPEISPDRPMSPNHPEKSRTGQTREVSTDQ